MAEFPRFRLYLYYGFERPTCVILGQGSFLTGFPAEKGNNPSSTGLPWKMTQYWQTKMTPQSAQSSCLCIYHSKQSPVSSLTHSAPCSNICFVLSSCRPSARRRDPAAFSARGHASKEGCLGNMALGFPSNLENGAPKPHARQFQTAIQLKGAPRT